jgi:SAM-dependent methyltransferase
MSPQNKSHLTAIHRTKLPGPTQWLFLKGLIPFSPKRVLDYGCGKAHIVNNSFFHADGYDPFYLPITLSESFYDVIICNYVLCVLPTEAERLEVLRKIQSLLKVNGVAYVSVRNDKPKNGHGWTSRGTYQADVKLNLNVLREIRQFRMYQLTKRDKI